jgi:hypothetical protein
MTRPTLCHPALTHAVRATPAVVLVLALAACGGSSTASTSAGTQSSAAASPARSATPPPSAGATSSGASSAATSAATPAADQTIHLTYAHGKVTGDTGRVPVKVGSTVALVVTSDVADEVHLHGYDKHVDVPKGGTATLVFTADKPGVFEAELEHLKFRLVQLQVQ